MQEKGTADSAAQEALSTKAEQASNTPESRREPKDGKFAFKKMKQPKKDKSDKKQKFNGDGVIFKAKLIGVEPVPDARGDKMCQEAMEKLKQNVKNIAPHKKKINVSVSLQGIKIKEEKNGTILYHHPVSLISFISQDITDARAFGYVFGSTEEPHQFIAIKTEKPAFHVVVAIRDLFQTVLNFKQEEIDIVKEKSVEPPSPQTTKKVENEHKEKDQTVPEENIYFEVLLAEPLQLKEEIKVAEPQATVDDLLQIDISKLKEGINQMDSTIAAVADTFNTQLLPEKDPFDTSFVLGPKRDSFSLQMPTPIPLATTSSTNEFLCQSTNEDKYAAFNTLDTVPSIFEVSSNPELSEMDHTKEDQQEEELKKTVPPAKPPRNTKTSQPDLSVFADLDPLGKDRPYKDKAEFFQDVKNPPKKVLNDLVDGSKEKLFDVNLFSPSVPFPVDFESNLTSDCPNALSSSLPNSFYTNTKLSLPIQHEDNPFDKQGFNPKAVSSKILTSRASEPSFKILHSSVGVGQNLTPCSYLGTSPLSNTHLGITQQIDPSEGNPFPVIPQINGISSSPIPIPGRQNNFGKDRCHLNNSPYSKSPIPDSPNHSEYFTGSDNYSPNGLIMKNVASNGEYLPTISPPTNISHKNSRNSNSHNPTSRPRPRPSSSIPISGFSHSSHSLSSDSSSDYEAISRDSMQLAADVLRTGGYKLRAQSLCQDIPVQGNKNIFTKKKDPFADEFFFSLPKRANHLTNTEIPEYV